MTDHYVFPDVRLLWPASQQPIADTRNAWGENAVNDLGIAALVDALSPKTHLKEKFRAIFLSLSPDPAVIRYRQAVLEDILNSANLEQGLNDLLPRLTQLAALSDYPFSTFLEQIISRLGALEVYVEAVEQLKTLLESDQVGVRSEGFMRLREAVQGQAADPSFRALAEQLPELRQQAAAVTSMTIGVNLDSQMRPVAATLLSFNDQPFTGGRESLLGRLLGGGERSEYQGLAPLHAVPKEIPGLSKTSARQPDPLMFPLFKDLDRVLRRTVEPVARALQQYVHLHGRALAVLEPEIAFYLSGARLIRGMADAGLPMCRAEIAPLEERVCRIEGLYNLNLALRLALVQRDLSGVIVLNDVAFGDQGRIFILTGPNQGGKTTFTQAVGLAQVLFQAGLYVPGHSARISPVDAIFTHFPLEEKPQVDEGRLGEEAQRLSSIFERATRHSLVLLNESLSTTSPGEGIYLAREVVQALRLWGTRAVFVTHLHELAEGIEQMEAAAPGDSRIASLVAGVADGADPAAAADGGVRRSYRVTPAPPMGLSFARDIAARHGISYEQLAKKLQEREQRSDGASGT